MKFAGTSSSVLMLWASVASLFCAPTGVLGRAIPASSLSHSLDQSTSNLEIRAEQTFDFQILKRTSGAKLKPDEVETIMTTVDDNFGKGMPPTTETSVSARIDIMNVYLGIYAGKDVDPTKLVDTIQDFGKKFTNGTSFFGAQNCGEGVAKDQIIGFVLGDENDWFDAADKWHNGNCLTEFESEKAWKDVAVTLRSSKQDKSS